MYMAICQLLCYFLPCLTLPTEPLRPSWETPPHTGSPLGTRQASFPVFCLSAATDPGGAAGVAAVGVIDSVNTSGDSVPPGGVFAAFLALLFFFFALGLD